MKKRILTKAVSALCSVVMVFGIVSCFGMTASAASDISISSGNFPDDNFRNWLLGQSFGTDKKLTQSEISGLKELNVSHKSISDLKGIEYLTSLEKLDCSDNRLKALDVRSNTSLTNLNCESNYITLLDVSKNTALTTLICSSNKLTNLDIRNNTSLTTLSCYRNTITGLDVSKNTALEYIDCAYNNIPSLDVSNNTALDYIKCSNNELSSLDVSNNTALDTLECSFNQISDLKLGNKPCLKTLLSDVNKLKDLDVSKCPDLRTLSCATNQITNIDVSNSPKLFYCYCHTNQLTSLDLTMNPEISVLYCNSNNFDAVYACVTEDQIDYLSLGTEVELVTLSNSDWTSKVEWNADPDLSSTTATVQFECTKEGHKDFKVSTPMSINVTSSLSATCDKSGYVSYEAMLPAANSRTGVEITDTTRIDIPAKGHSWGDWKVTKEATADAEGEETRICKDDPSHKETRKIPKLSSSTDSQSQILDFVRRIYIYVLDREPDKDGAAFWSDELYTFRRTGAEVAQGFIFSPEFESRNTTDEEFVTILYKTFFGRDPEDEGKNYWLGRLKNGASRMEVANGFIYSQEWADTCAEYGIRSGGSLKPQIKIEPTELTYSFVERMYTTAFKRTSDVDGCNFWADKLANYEMTGEEVGAFFFLSEEMDSYGLSDEEFVTRLYKTFMNRDPETEGYNYWVSVLKNGSSRSSVVYGFTRSQEFVDKCIEARIVPF